VRTLIVGAGVAGLTLAAGLAQQGRHATVVERFPVASDGYALGLYPLGSCTLHGLGAYRELLARGLVLERYELADYRDRLLQVVDTSVLTGGLGPILMVGRSRLLEILERAAAGSDLRRQITVSSLEISDSEVGVRFTDGTDDRFDLVVACDGIASAVRQMVFGSASGFDSGWILWTWWTHADQLPSVAAREWWGRGWFLGAYPAPGRIMCAAGGPAAEWDVGGDGSVPGLLSDRLRPLIARVEWVGRAVTDASGAYSWRMRDVRARRWSDHRVVLCGDSAVAFLPTAGVGASSAMRLAAALADELSRADAQAVPLALERYEKRCRRIVERNQTDSRRLAHAMFVRNPALAWLRDQVVRRYPPERALANVVASAREPF
jgi:2-polyprenyl-6-methoxyphenol hydroxylase-like FAD-dependent oxidoreductase